MKRILLSLLPVVALPLMAAAPDGQAIAQHGNNNGAMPCAACHGANFQGNPGINAPALAGEPAATILAALNNFASNPASNAMMHQVASALSPAERQAVATYLAAQPKS